MLFLMAMNIFSDISLWWSLPWAVLSIAIAFWYYRKQKSLEGIATWLRTLLTFLRASALFLLGILLLGILLETSETKLEKPVFIVMVDNSSSMKNYKDSTIVAKKIQDFETALEQKYADRFDVVTYTVDDDVRTDKPNYQGKVSNLDAGFSHIYNQFYNRNIGGICFVSDGNYNQGNSPQYTAEKIAMTPIFSVGVGDTVKKRDQLIRHVAVNDIAFYKNQFPIEIDIEASKMGKAKAVIDLYQGKDKIASQNIQYNGEALDFQHVSFVVDANTIGFVNYTVRLQILDGESSKENNARSMYIEVIDSRSQILILSQAPHPDVAAIKQVLDKDPNAQVTSELVADWKGQLKDVELLIWHGAGNTQNVALTNEIKRLKIPVWYIIPSAANRNGVSALGIGVSLPGDRRTDEVQGYASSGFQLFEISEKVDAMLSKAPPITVKFGTTQVEGAALISQRIGPVKKKDPVLVFGKNAQSKHAVFIGEGLWRWRLSEYARTKKHEGFEELIQKTVQYLVVRKNTDPFRVNLPKRFTTNDEVIIQAEFYNEAFEPITTPDVQLELKDEANKVVPYTFAKNAKDYTLGLGKMAPGKYAWKATTSFNGKKYQKDGVFIVEEISLESLATSADHNLLKLMADQSSGKFYSLAQLDQLLKDLDTRKDIVTVAYEETDYSDLIDWKWIFVLAALFLATEWFLRRWHGTY